MKRPFILISDNFPPCKGGGIAEWAYGIASNMAGLGYEVTVLSRWKNKNDRLRYRNHLFQTHHMQGRDWNRYRYWYALSYLFRQLQQQPDSMVIATTWELAAPMNILRHLFPKSRYIVIAHGLEITKINKTQRSRQLQNTLAHALLTFAVSRFTKNEILHRMYGRTLSVRFLPNGVDAERFHHVTEDRYLREKFSIPDNAHIILTLARVIERKGHDTVIRALPEILEQFPDTIYIIAGPWENNYYNKLLRLIEELRLTEHVRFTSFIDESDLNTLYSTSDIYVMISRIIESAGDTEGFGITFLEANACGCPVIGSYSGGIPDAIEEGINGFLVAPDDYRALAEKILLLFNNRELRSNIAEKAKERITEQFSWKTITQQFLSAVESELDKQSLKQP
ncbi:MAG: glycosyltransferase family 4 protein [Chlorobiaceae bacterium]|nr:glycosyltransferase family 4 protein [Chlorobiaceae bacterium]